MIRIATLFFAILLSLALAGPAPAEEIRKDFQKQYDVSPDDDVRLHLEHGGGIGGEFTIDTDDGSIRVDIPDIRVVEKRGNSVSGVIGDGNGNIRVRSSDGSVTLRERA